MALQQLDQKSEESTLYRVELEVISGHGLASKDIGGKSDPYVKIKIGNREEKTKIIQNSLNPVFNAKYSFEFLTNPKTIEFEVLDKDLTSDDHLGNATYNLNEQFNAKDSSKSFTGHLKLNNKKKKAQGTIKVRIRGTRLLPVTLAKIAEQQKETIYKQNQQIDNLSIENENYRKENNQLKKTVENQSNQPGSENEPILNQKPTKRSNREIIISYIEYIITKILSIWQIILSRCIYGFPFIGYYIDLVILFFGSLLRLEVGYNVFRGATSSKRPPKQLLKLYEYEGSIDCKMVRETLCALDLDCIIYPCPPPQHYLSRYRDEAKQLCGKSNNFPVLIDENYGDDGPLILLNSKQIIRYLYDEYGNNVKKNINEKVRYYIANHAISIFIYKYFYLGLLRSLPKHGMRRYGNTVKPNNYLELWSYEASPFCIKVREVLSSLEIPYVLKNVAVGSKQKRQEFKIRFGKKYPKWRQSLHLIQVPLLVDPNTEKEIFESEDIKKYLMKTYCTSQ
eukprot:390580_1